MIEGHGVQAYVLSAFDLQFTLFQMIHKLQNYIGRTNPSITAPKWAGGHARVHNQRYH